jgi:hypothetical protein
LAAQSRSSIIRYTSFSRIGRVVSNVPPGCVTSRSAAGEPVTSEMARTWAFVNWLGAPRSNQAVQGSGVGVVGAISGAENTEVVAALRQLLDHQANGSPVRCRPLRLIPGPVVDAGGGLDWREADGNVVGGAKADQLPLEWPSSGGVRSAHPVSGCVMGVDRIHNNPFAGVTCSRYCAPSDLTSANRISSHIHRLA